MPFRNRGFSRPATRKGKVSPVVAAARAIAAPPKRPPDAVPVERRGSGSDVPKNYRDPEPWWQGPLTEWVIWDDLTTRRKLIPQVDQQTGAVSEPYDFAFQQAAANSAERRGFFRADFVFPPTSRALGTLGPEYPGGLILDPYSDFTHPLRGADIIKRAGLNGSELPALIIFLEQHALLADPHWLIGEALAGRDYSNRG